MGWLWALPLQPSCGQESPLAGWSRAGAQGPGRYSCGLVIGKRCPYGLVPGEHRPLRVGHRQAPLLWPWPRMAALQGPLSQPATPFPCCLRCKNAARMRRIVLHDVISSHTV
ncbi:hypothetical protein BHM03_00042969 [Ensete ventricosum]|nr:hypothetical protein BHM03_00042969 [Ensete ventricosum]